MSAQIKAKVGLFLLGTSRALSYAQGHLPTRLQQKSSSFTAQDVTSLYFTDSCASSESKDKQ